MGNVVHGCVWAGFRVFGSVCGRVYRLLFARADRRLARRNQERLLADLRLALSQVLKIHGGSIRPRDQESFPPPFDYALAIVQFDNFAIRVVRGRDEIEVQVAPTNAATDWQDLRIVLLANRASEQSPTPARFNTLSEVGELLLSKWDYLTAALAEPNYQATREALNRLYGMPLERQWASGSEHLRQTIR
jgi:hypothetical protein